MFWNKNDDINKEWKDYERYKREKEARDREYYQNDYPQYQYNENEHHVHDKHCDIGLRTPGEISKDRLKNIRAAVVFIVAFAVIMAFAFRVVKFRKIFDKPKEKEIPLKIYYLTELDGFSIYDVRNVDNKIEVDIKKIKESDLETAEVEFAFYDESGKIIEHNVSRISIVRMKVNTTRTAKSIKIPSDSKSVLIKLKEPTS